MDYTNLDAATMVAIASIIISGVTIAIGAVGPAIGEGLALARALQAMSQQPDESDTISRTLFVGMALIESTAIYCFVVAMILIFFNPFWDQLSSQLGG